MESRKKLGTGGRKWWSGYDESKWKDEGREGDEAMKDKR